MKSRFVTANFSDNSTIRVELPKGANAGLVEKALHRTNTLTLEKATRGLTRSERHVVGIIITERDRRTALARAEAKAKKDAEAAAPTETPKP